MRVFIDQPDLLLAGMPVGPFAMNEYLIACPRQNKAAIIDSGADPAPFLELAHQRGLDVVELLQTHGHIDHIAELRQTRDATGCKVRMHPLDLDNLRIAPQYGKMIGFAIEHQPDHDIDLAEGDTINLGDLSLDVMHTPGHAPGHVCFHERNKNVLIGGDLLFRMSIGRTDLPGCNHDHMIASLRRMLELDDAVRVFPGHMDPTTIGFERRANPFLQGIR